MATSENTAVTTVELCDCITACPGCGCEPEITRFYVDSVTKAQRGYDCTCGVHVVDGIVLGYGHTSH